jgi:flagellar motor switch protein FliM
MLKQLNNLKEAWENIIQVSPRIEQIESNSQFVQIVGPNEMVALITFEVKIGDMEGMMNLCLPYPMIEPIVPKLSAQYWFSNVKKEGTAENLQALRERLNKVSVPLIAELGETEIKLNDLLNLKKGDVININQPIDGVMKVKVGNKVKFKGIPGKIGKKMAISIKEITNEEDGD